MAFYKCKYISDGCLNKTILFADNYHDAFNIIRGISKDIIFINKAWFLVRNVKIKNIMEWFNNLNLLLKEGVNIEDALINLSEDYEYTLSILNMTRVGIKFNTALVYHRFFFDDTSIKIVDSLTDSVPIESVVSFISKYHQNMLQNKNKFFKSIFLPLLTLVIAVLVTIFLVYFIKEPIKEAFVSINNVELPKLFYIIDQININKIMIMILIIFAVLYFLIKYFKELPLINIYYKNRDLLICFYIVSFLLQNGVHLLKAISVVSETSNTRSLKKGLRFLQRDLIKGNSLYQSMIILSINPIYKNIIKIYENTGNLGDGFYKCSLVAQSFVDNHLNYLANIINPAITCFTVLIVLVFLNYTIFPLYNILLNFNL